MRTSIFLILGAFTLSLFGQGNTIDWRDGRPGVRVVTNSLQAGQIMGLIDAAGQAKAGTGDVARIEGELAAHTNRIDNPHGVTAEQIGAITSAPPQSVLSVNSYTGVVSLTAADVGTLSADEIDAAFSELIKGIPNYSKQFRLYGTNENGEILLPYYFESDVLNGILTAWHDIKPNRVMLNEYHLTTGDVWQAVQNVSEKIADTNDFVRLSGGTATNLDIVGGTLYGDEIYQAGELVATTGHVAQAIAAIPEPDLSGKADVQDGVATNLSTHGWLALPQTAPTNLVLRLVCSNEHIIVQEVYP